MEAMAKTLFNRIDIAVAILSLLTFILDVSTDILVCAQLLLEGKKVWGWLMVAMVAIPSFLMNGFSVAWHIHDKSCTSSVVLRHLLLVAPVDRYVNVIYLGVRSRATGKVVHAQKALRAQSDISILRLLEAFLESAPQLVLQLYIMLSQQRVNWFGGISAICSLVSLTWAMTAYSDSQRRAHSSVYHRRFIRLALHWAWQLFVTIARIAAFVFFAFVLNAWVFTIMGGHWIVSFLWISVRGTDFGFSCCEKWMFRLVCAFIYIFVFLNLNDGMSRWRITAYYLLMLGENVAMVVTFLVLGSDTNLFIVACLATFGGFFIGLTCMMVYYGLLHPTSTAQKKNVLKLQSRLDLSRSSKGTDPQIFSIESPSQMTGIEGTAMNLSSNIGSPAVYAQNTYLTNQSSGCSQPAVPALTPSHQALQKAWQCNMESSSNSSSNSSLASAEMVSANVKVKRGTSGTSNHSSHSTSSESQLLLTTSKNNLSKSPRKMAQQGMKTHQGYMRTDLTAGDVNESDSLNVTSRSPTLSRGSWARSSDNRYSFTPGEFTVLGFDDSSIDRRPSDSSSFSSRPVSLSPLDVSNLWQDAHGRLRATIAATVAAAMPNPSSNESTPNKNQPTSHTSNLSSQDESLAMVDGTGSSHKQKTFVDAEDEYKERGAVLNRQQQTGSRELTHDGEVQSSLPDILKVINYKQGSNLDIMTNSYKLSGSSNDSLSPQDKTTIAKARRLDEIGLDMNSPIPENSTLTVSKLGLKKSKSVSYFDALKRDRLSLADTITPDYLSTDLSEEKTIATQIDEQSHSGDSPFSDRELLSVMTKSLQSYIGGSYDSTSQHPEREGLALTLEDLKFSHESTPDRKQGGINWRSRSASSLFHDSPESSPASSASKMNRTVVMEKKEDELSPNALKYLDYLPQQFCNIEFDSLSMNDNETVASQSQGLKFIMDSYASEPLKSPGFSTRQSSHPKGCNRRSLSLSSASPSATAPSHNNSISSTPRGDPLSITELCCTSDTETLMNNGKNSPRKLERYNGHNSSLVRNRSSLTYPDVEMTLKPPRSQAREGVSSIRKMHVSDFPILEYERSPFHKGQRKVRIEDCEKPDVGGYVSGKYCPPLCADTDSLQSEEAAVARNLDFKYSTNSGDWSVNEKSKSTAWTSQSQRATLDEEKADYLDYIRERNAMKRNSRLQKYNSDFFHLQQRNSVHDSPHFRGSISQPQLLPRLHNFSDNKELLNIPVSILESSKHIKQRMPHKASPKHSKGFESISDDKLRASAQLVSDYFTEALNTSSRDLSYHVRLKDNYGLSHLGSPNSRQPLQQLNNSQQVSPQIIASSSADRLRHLSESHISTAEHRIHSSSRFQSTEQQMKQNCLSETKQKRVTFRPPVYGSHGRSTRVTRSASTPSKKNRI